MIYDYLFKIRTTEKGWHVHNLITWKQTAKFQKAWYKTVTGFALTRNSVSNQCRKVNRKLQGMPQSQTAAKPRHQEHPAGDVTRVSVMPRKVTVKIGDAENRCRWCRDKNQWKRAKLYVRLVLSWVPFKSGVWNWAYKMPKYVLSLLVKPKLKNLLSVLRYRLPRFRSKRQNQRVATFWRH